MKCGSVRLSRMGGRNEISFRGELLQKSHPDLKSKVWWFFAAHPPEREMVKLFGSAAAVVGDVL